MGGAASKWELTTHSFARIPPVSFWDLHPYNTQVEFSARHLGMMTVRGNFLDVTTNGYIDPDHPEASLS
jgi:polyisoprenoid-binding protein YceI